MNNGFYHTKRLYYVTLFIAFGLIIAFFTSIITYRFQLGTMETQLIGQAEDIFEEKLLDLEDYTEGLEYIVASLRDSLILYDYLQNPNAGNRKRAIELFKAVSLSNPALMQARFLDEKGREKIRIDWAFGKERPEIVRDEDLQDKGHRYYFSETARLGPTAFWYSKLDLNVENRRIEVPHKPVMRVASPVFIDQRFHGIVIINVHSKEFLNNLAQNPIFDICIIDGDGYFIISHQEERSWARYLETGHKVGQYYPQRYKEILYDDHSGGLRKYDELFVGSINAFLTKDQGRLLLHPKHDAIAAMQKDRRNASLFIIILILLLSIPLALLISKRPAELHRKIAEQNRELSESIRLIDNNIHTGKIDLDGRFVEGSQAFADTLGMKKSQFAGMHYSQLFCRQLPVEFYHEIWRELQQGNTWSGEIQHSKANGDCYWADTLFVPRKNVDGEVTSFSAIYHDITDKKQIEQLSITDVMTGLYNRRFFNTVIEREFGRAKRDEKLFSFAMLDVDFFKNYNDNYGHQQGDFVLQEIATVISEKLHRGSDYCFRLGGEEFGVIFVDLSSDEALDFVNTIREAIVSKNIEHKWSVAAEVITVSIGLLCIKPTDDVTVDTVYRVADEALYEAKNKGRNRVVAKVMDFEE